MYSCIRRNILELVLGVQSRRESAKSHNVISKRRLLAVIGFFSNASLYLQIVLSTLDNEKFHEMEKRAEQLKDFSQTDITGKINLWKETIQIRRQYISEHSTSDIITQYPGYSHSLLVSETVFSFCVPMSFHLKIIADI